MVRHTFCALALVVLLVGGASGKQEPPRHGPPPKGPGPRAPEACDMKKVEVVSYCSPVGGCGMMLEAKDVAEHQKNKDLRGHKIVKRKACSKKYFQAECHPENRSLEKAQCCGKDMVEKISKSLIYWLCEGCGHSSDEEGTCGFFECPKKKPRQECSLQPEFPHTNEALWRKKQKEAADKDKKDSKEKKDR